MCAGFECTLLTADRLAMYRLIVIALCTGISAAQAQISSRMEFGCSEPVAVCTQMRVKQLLLQSRQLAGAAALGE